MHSCPLLNKNIVYNKEKSDLEASLHLLKSRKAVAVALVEATAYEEATESGELVEEPQVPNKLSAQLNGLVIMCKSFYK